MQTADFELYKPIDEQMGFHEKLRLLYVACTRARDHLVVSVHRKARHSTPTTRPAGPTPSCSGTRLTTRRGRRSTPNRRPAPPESLCPRVAPAEPGLAPEVWQDEYDRAHQRGNRRGFVSATTLAHRLDAFAPGSGVAADDDPGLAKEGRDLELPPWNKGRYGTAIGRAVHATLQTIDLGTGAGVDATAAAQAAAEGVLGHEPTIVALTRAALASAVVTRAAARRYWRETYVAVPFDGITLEGYVDLVFRDDDGLVVVDYKTDAVDEPDTAANAPPTTGSRPRRTRSRSREATGEPVVRGGAVLPRPGGRDRGRVRGRRPRRRGRGGAGVARGRTRRSVPAAPARACRRLSPGRGSGARPGRGARVPSWLHP